MAVVAYADFDHYLERTGEGRKADWAPLYYLYGEEYLRAKAFDALVDRLLPAGGRTLDFEPVSAATESLHTALEKVNTYSFSRRRKVVAYLEGRLFHPDRGAENLIAKALEAWREPDAMRAARIFMRVLGRLDLSLDALGSGEKGEDAWPGGVDGRELAPIADYCRQQKLPVPKATDDAAALQAALERGFPPNHHLVVTGDTVDRRRALFKALDGAGVVVDCSVPTGSRVADRRVQQQVLQQTAGAALEKAGKTLAPDAFQTLVEKTGFAPRVLAGHVEKLIQFAGDRSRIEAGDVAALLVRTRQDPVFELTEALADRDLEKALGTLGSLLADGVHPLQVLGAVAGLARRLIVAKTFIASNEGAAWYAGCAFGHFKARVLPGLEAFTTRLSSELARWDRAAPPLQHSETDVSPGKGRGGKKAADVKTDLLFANSRQNPYPAYQALRKAEGHGLRQLLEALTELARTDRALKSGAQDARLALEALVFRICRDDTSEG
jgi:DNA polymerase-3 subunit delta